MKSRKQLSDIDDQSTTGDDEDYRKKRERNNQVSFNLFMFWLHIIVFVFVLLSCGSVYKQY